MREQTSSVPIQVATVSDRGLSEKRPLNEDSYLSDSERGIFAVADGVGGAQAGEVASKTAVEVLDEAFRHQVDGADIEDLMEIAIQRANTSIHQMALDHPKLAAMATTVVALHLDGYVATIGHVGDSRLYRLTPDGKLHRETADHSVVEEEVRAGRMTPEQAAHHPSRNVISRALGAETGVEVDMKTIEVEDGTAFLLCSDGITRHLPDNELRDLLAGAQDVEAICAEMKRLCYERGAEDNLTAVIVRVGERTSKDEFSAADERTVQSTRSALATTVDSAGNPPQPVVPLPVEPPPAVTAVPASSAALPPPPVNKDEAIKTNPLLALEAQGKSSKRKGGGGRAFLLLLLIAGIGAAAFYGGIYFQRQRTDSSAQASASVTPTPAPTPADLVAEFEKKRHEVDKDPAKMRDTLKDEAAAKGTQNPLDSTDPEFLYLYGRSLLLTGDYLNALPAFERASANVTENTSALYDKLRVESRLAIAAAALKLRIQHPDAEQRAVRALDEMVNKAVSPPVIQK
ncbi:MAG: family protein phosphatase [Acidobacteriota bacterium]|jgi:protein phosphatase|nr:family protein phosphatase [Acidobacteriota bacterium]